MTRSGKGGRAGLNVRPPVALLLSKSIEVYYKIHVIYAVMEINKKTSYLQGIIIITFPIPKQTFRVATKIPISCNIWKYCNGQNAVGTYSYIFII